MTAETYPKSTDNPERQMRPLWWLRILVGPLLFLAVGVSLIVLLGVAQRIGWLQTSGGGPVAGDTAAGVIYTCAMHPQIRQPAPGRCPICGMALVSATDKGLQSDSLSVTISPAARRVANIQTVVARRIALSRTIRAVGLIDYDESQLATIAAYVDGRVETLYGDYTGVKVERGKDMVRLYSPQFYAAQTEFLQAKKMLETARRDRLDRLVTTQRKLVKAAQRKLFELGMTDEQIATLEKRGEAEMRIAIRAPIEGTVIEKRVVEGQYVKAGDVIYRVANLRVVWLKLKLFPKDIPYIRYGQRVVAEVQSWPGESFQGRVAFIDPMVEEKTRTVGVRVVISNPEGQLRIGDYATAKIEVPIGERGRVYDDALAGKYISPRHPQIVSDKPGICPLCGIDLVPTSELGFSSQPVARRPAMVVPRSAILKVGDKSVVYVETKPGRFEIRYVELGPTTLEHAVILSGVTEGEMVATSGNFLIDSQMQISGNPSLIDPTKAKQAQAKIPSDKPLRLPEVNVKNYQGKAGEQLESLYQAYFKIQQQLAHDKKPTGSQVAAVQTAVELLAAENELPPELKELIGAVAEHTAHLHHVDLAHAREEFKSVSHAVIRLSARARGSQANRRFFQFFCPMVRGGGGDWLQAGEPLANPYWGAEMLRCGEKQRELPAKMSDQNVSPAKPRKRAKG